MLLTLPRTLLVHVLANLQPAELGQLAACCDMLRRVCYGNVLWRPLLQRLHGTSSKYQGSDPTPCRTLFRECIVSSEQAAVSRLKTKIGLISMKLESLDKERHELKSWLDRRIDHGGDWILHARPRARVRNERKESALFDVRVEDSMRKLDEATNAAAREQRKLDALQAKLSQHSGRLLLARRIK